LFFAMNAQISVMSRAASGWSSNPPDDVIPAALSPDPPRGRATSRRTPRRPSE
jgi:hypothetical protein